MIILDTNVVSELMRRNPDPDVVAWTDRQFDTTLYLTTITLAEIRFGIAALPDGERRRQLDAAFESEIRPLFEDRILAFDERASVHNATLRAAARARGAAIGDWDALIAAIALAHDFAVATRDTAPFVEAEVDVIDPWTAA
ncbi:MAG: VapC toxin family PIN domain ribonuclease [Microbacterium sp.]|nr:MAG: VapC toxin family PIN domain ribonuclease [Microbacterium sp.]